MKHRRKEYLLSYPRQIAADIVSGTHWGNDRSGVTPLWTVGCPLGLMLQFQFQQLKQQHCQEDWIKNTMTSQLCLRFGTWLGIALRKKNQFHHRANMLQRFTLRKLIWTFSLLLSSSCTSYSPIPSLKLLSSCQANMKYKEWGFIYFPTDTQ